MIPILYEHNESSFNTFGIGPLAEASSCEVTEERNGGYELVLKYPTNGRMINEITKERILRAQVNDNKSIQTFRIYRISIPINGFITVYAQHISYDLSGVVAFPCSFTNSNPQQIMSFLAQRRLDRVVPFSFYSDISNTSSIVIDQPRTLRNILGAEKDSLASIFHGEFLWDNFEVKYLANRGSNNGVTILYGKNLTKLEHNSDLSGVYTHLCPFAKVKEGDTIHYLELQEKKIALTTTLTETKVLIKDFSSLFGTGEGKLQPTEANLRQAANDFILANPTLGIEVPNITLSFEQLRGQFGYSNLHETVNLCDIVTVKYPSLGIDIQTKIVKVVYDVLKEKFKSLTIGASKATLVDTTTHTQQEVDETSQAVTEIPSYIEEAISHATEQITGANGGCVVIDMDNQSRPYELLVMNDYSKEDATKVWRWNINGLGFSPNGYNGPYTTAITSDGHIVADFIDTGSLTANILKAGTIQALTGDSYWNLETGVLHLTGEINATSGTFSNVTIDETCTINGNMYLNGELSVGDRWGGAYYEYETRIGGDGIQTDMDIRTYNPYGNPTYQLKSDGYMTPIGTITVPKGRQEAGQYSDIWNDMVFGISYDYSFLSSHMLAGLHLAIRYINGEGEHNLDQYQLHLSARGDLIELSYDSRYPNGQYCNWGHYSCDNYLVRDFWVGTRDYGKNSAISFLDKTDSNNNRKTYGYLKGRWYFSEDGYVEAKNFGNYTRPVFYGDMYFSSKIYYGTDQTGYQIRIDPDQVTFYYANQEVGELECYQQYVDVQGTWKTNGNNWISTSDVKTKKDIEELDEKLSALFDLLKPRKYKFKKGTSNRYHTGFVVQEILEAMKEVGISNDDYGLCCAFGDSDDPETEWGMRYEEIIALCVKEIQTLKSRVEELEDKK